MYPRVLADLSDPTHLKAAIGYQLSAISYRLSAIGYRLKL
jgi:hypothetical protein